MPSPDRQTAPAAGSTARNHRGPRRLAGDTPLHAGELTIRMATAFGFCQGVRRAVDRALQAAAPPPSDAPRRNPSHDGAASSRLFVTGEIIHNPAINQQLLAAGVERLPPPGTPHRLSAIRPTDRVIVPAFGIELHEEQQLQAIGCEIIDTTCGWVRKVWRVVREFAADGLTVLVHGRTEHEETRATVSRIPGPYVILRDHAAARQLADRLRETATGQIGRELSGDRSPDFDPQRDLARLGLVTQTTMLSSETAAIAATLREAMQAQLGRPPGHECFRTLDTFCPATQQRQDAVRALLAAHPIDTMIVVGGFRSSNTAHLARLASDQVPTFHVENAECLLSRTAIRHLAVDREVPEIAPGWFPRLPAVIGITAGASTPDDETQGIISRLIELKDAAENDSISPPPSKAENR